MAMKLARSRGASRVSNRLHLDQLNNEPYEASPPSLATNLAMGQFLGAKWLAESQILKIDPPGWRTNQIILVIGLRDQSG